MFNDISPDFRWNATDTRIGRELLKLEGTPAARWLFAKEIIVLDPTKAERVRELTVLRKG
ncbi:hypothetical protein [Aneurinibacillus terranovensis]|uniref:hypothetical protein n=1 Tax=Aneurinibacillus terranovensis TaxID=278991 RepID=UPI000487401D|nr:hypothetical protein [Aneurinibacillus terranovensis]